MDDEKQRLTSLDGIIWLETSHGFTAAASKAMINWLFYGQKDLKGTFSGNPANTFEYRTLNAAVDSAAIGTYEAIKEEKRRRPLNFEVPGFDKLRCHRLHSSHPWVYEWTDQSMKDFVAKELHRTDNPAVRMWQAREAVLRRLNSLGVCGRPPLSVIPLKGAGNMIRNAIESELRPSVVLSPDFNSNIIEFFHHYENHLRKEAEQET